MRLCKLRFPTPGWCATSAHWRGQRPRPPSRGPAHPLQLPLVSLLQVAAKFVVAETEVRLRSAASAGIRTIVEAMSSHQYNPDVQQAGCKALSDLAVKLRGQKEQETGVLGMRAAVAALRCLTASAPVQACTYLL